MHYSCRLHSSTDNERSQQAGRVYIGCPDQVLVLAGSGDHGDYENIFFKKNLICPLAHRVWRTVKSEVGNSKI